MSHPLVKATKAMLQEAFEGPSGNSSWFTNSRPNTGIFGTLAEVSAKEASIPVHGTAIAAHADHTRYYLSLSNSILAGEQPEGDWEKSWRITTVDETEWNRIQEELKSEYRALLEKIDAVEWKEQSASELLGSLAHSTYHLGAILQMVKAVKASENPGQ